MCDSYHGFDKYWDINKFDNFFLKSKYSFLTNFFNDLVKLNKLKTQKNEEKNKCVW